MKTFNKVIGIAPWGKVYARKINVYIENPKNQGMLNYMYSTNAYRTCRDAKSRAQADYPGAKVCAYFAKD